MFSTTSTMTRRRLLPLGLAVSLAAGSPLRTLLVSEVDASPNSKKRATSIAKRAKAQADWCERVGGTATITVRPGGTTVSCKGGQGDGTTCIITSKTERCFQTAPPPPSPVTDPATPPTNGNEQPSDNTQAGGGAGVDPGAGNEQPDGAGGGVVVTSSHSGHHRHGHGTGHAR